MKLKIALGARLVDYYQSWLNFKGGYTPPEPVNSSSENELEGGEIKRGNQKESITREARRHHES